MLVDYYLRILHLDRRMPLNFDVGPVHVHLYARSVFFMWVTVVVLVVAGIAVLASRRRELIRRWTTWVMIAPVVGIPIWIGRGTTAVLAAALAVVAVMEYARLVKLGKVDTYLLLLLAVLYRSRPGCTHRCCVLRRSSCWRVRCPRCSAVMSNMAAGAPRSPRSVRCGSAGPWRTW
jgi:hypothetical protein